MAGGRALKLLDRYLDLRDGAIRTFCARFPLMVSFKSSNTTLSPTCKSKNSPLKSALWKKTSPSAALIMPQACPRVRLFTLPVVSFPAYTGLEGTPRDEEGDRIERPFIGLWGFRMRRPHASWGGVHHP